MNKTAEQLWKVPGTPMKKLTGLDFRVFLYALEAPRRYEGLPMPNTIGFGYYGKDECMQHGLAIVCARGDWLRANIKELRAKHGKHFPDLAQYEFIAGFASDDERIIGKRLLTEDECYAKARELSERRHG